MDRSWPLVERVGCSAIPWTGARASAVVYSLMLTCRACGIEPLTYSRHTFSELPQRAPKADITDLLPFNFAKATAA